MIKNRIIILAISLIIFCFSLTTVISIVSLNSVISDDSKEVSKLLATRIYDSINSELIKPITVGKAMANDIFLIDEIKNESRMPAERVEEDLRLYLQNIKNNFEYESSFLVSDISKKYYTYKGLNKIIDVENDSHDIWYKIFVDSEKEYDLDVDLDEVNKGRWTVFINVRLEDAKKNFLGVCGVGIQMTNMQDLLATYEKEYGIKINLVNPEGVVQVDTDETNIESAVLETIGDIKRVSKDYVYTAGATRGTYTITKYIEDLGWYLVVKDDSANRGVFSHMILLNLAAFVLVLIVLFIAVRIIIIREKLLKRVSEVDKMTGALNRLAYENYLTELRQKDSVLGFSVFVFDVNELKRTNDTLGHDAGDELIKAAAGFIKDFGDKWGTVFRTGGDEFVMITEAHFDKEARIAEFKKIVNAWKGTLVSSISISIGCVTATETTADIDELIKHADREMYKDKEEFYRTSGNDRRRR